MPAPRLPRGLNPQQRKAIRTTDGPVLVLAGAGTGKTRVVTERIAYLLRLGVKPKNILAVTFTNKAAGEMKTRVSKIVRGQQDLSDMIISTFHSLCVRILRRDPEAIGYRPGFTICDQGEQLGLVRKAARHVRGVGRVKPEDLLFPISRLKTRGVTPQQAARTAVEEDEQRLASVYRRYQEHLKALNAFDFDDLLIKAVELLSENKKARNHWLRRFKYIMVDEFQDTSTIQMRLVDLLTGKSRNLCVVGDDDQAIYAWRGAVTENLLQFQKRYPKTAMIRLEENYRSTNTILQAANHLIANNASRCEKTLWSNLGPGHPIRVFACEDQHQEAERIVGEIKQAVGQKEVEAGAFAVILRTNAQARPFEEELRSNHLPYVVIGGQSFYDRKEVRDVLSFLTVIANPHADSQLLRIVNTPARGIGTKTVTALTAHAQKKKIPISAALKDAGNIKGLNNRSSDACVRFGRQIGDWRKLSRGKKLQELVETVLEETAYVSEIEHLYDDPVERSARINMALEVADSLRNHLGRDPKTGLVGFLQEAALWGKDDQTEKEQDRTRGSVKLITAHSAKGLEFPRVYVAGMEEGLMPHRNAEEAGTIDEERRLCYVALTRARQHLTLSHCTTRVMRGKATPRAPSRFLGELPEDLLDRRDTPSAPEDTLSAIRDLRKRLEDRAKAATISSGKA